MSDTSQEPKAVASGDLALAIVIEDLKARVAQSDLSEGDARDIVKKALERFLPDYNLELHALVDGPEADDDAMR